MNPQQQALEAAMLARMVGSHLHGVDSMTVERISNQANKIDMQKYIKRYGLKAKDYTILQTKPRT
jgi:hypothetical protein